MNPNGVNNERNYFMKRIIPIMVLCLIACKNSNNDVSEINNIENHTLDFGAFTIVTPKSWKKINEKGIDSYVGGIAIDEKDTLFFDLGCYSNNLNEESPNIIERSLLEDMKNIDTTDYIIVENTRKVDYDKFRKQNLKWDTIDNYLTKIVFPIKQEIGITGIYIDSLWVNGSSIDKFNLYGTNLRTENEKAFLKVIHTIKFNKKND